MRKITLKNFLTALLIFTVGLTANAQNIISNGDFESWTGGNPDGWTTIDPGITVTEETTIIYEGSSSASIDVTTGDQGDTDIWQTVSVIGGTEYNVSVWVYHTEGNMKARLYVADYRNYSDNTITGSWQEVTYSYTPSVDSDIEVGLRFYDQTGFDGAEIVYVDDFLMEPSGGGGGTGQTIFLETFDANLGATTQHTVLGDGQVWEWANYGNPAGCSKMSGYDGGAQENEDWLITNAANCNNYSNITLTFDHARNYADNSGLSVLISTDYDGSSDPTTSGTWTDLTSQFTFPSSGSWNFIDAGTVDVSTYVGLTTYVAFKYTSTTSGASTWEVDNIHIEGEFEAFARVVGNFQGWNTTDPDYVMSPNANGLLELTKNLPAADNEYKIIEGDTWNDENYPVNNQHIVLATAQDITWKVNYNANLVSHNLPHVTGNFFSLLGGNNWDPAEALGEMADPEGDDIYSLDVTVPTAGIYEFKITLNDNWDQNTAWGVNVPFYADGSTPTTFTYDFVNNEITSPVPLSALVTFIVYDTNGRNYDGFNLKGSWSVDGFYDSGWNFGNEHTAFYDDGTNGDVTAGDNVWTCEQQLVVDLSGNNWEWGINDTEHNWVAGNWQFTVPDDSPQTLSWEVQGEPALIINEIMYNSPGADEEWVELFNNTGASIDLENWKLIDSDASHTPIIIPSGYNVADGGYFTIAVATDGNFPFTPDYDGTGNFALNNSGDVVRLYNDDGILIDIVSYSDGDPWPTEPDGDGPSLALIDPDTDNSLAQSWAASLEDGGTPGEENFPPIPFVSVTSPNGGEYIEQGAEFEITWIYGFWDGNINIELVKEGENPEPIVYNLALSEGSFMWTVLENQETGNDYKVRISGVNDGDPVGESDDYFSIIEPYILPEIVITEIMYNPPESNDDSLEFLEFYNNGAELISMADFRISDGVGYTFPQDIEILPDTFLLVAKDSVAMWLTFGVEALQWTSGSLSNGGEPVELRDNFDNVIDFVPYDDYLPWDTLADGWGPSLTLCNPDLDNSLPESWIHSVHFAATNADGDSIWATPGFECQITLFTGFTADKQTVVVGDSVMFTDLTTGNPTSWNWTFEGGTPETFDGQSPPYIVYNQPGMWDVTLVVTDGVNTDSLTYVDYIYSGYLPEADFEADETIIIAGSFTNFTSLSTGDSLSYQWYFEGGTPDESADENPQEIYYMINEWATYDVTLIVMNPFGNDTLIMEDYIEVQPVGIIKGKLSDENVNLYPNPTNGEFTITLPVNVEAIVTITDLTGKMIRETESNGAAKLVLNGFEQGVYLVRIMDARSNSFVLKKLVIN